MCDAAGLNSSLRTSHKLHREFFATIGHFLRPGGIIVLQENNLGSTAETFREMIENAGLAIVFVGGCAPQRTPDSRIYYTGVVRRGDVVPSWASSAECPAVLG